MSLLCLPGVLWVAALGASSDGVPQLQGLGFHTGFAVCPHRLCQPWFTSGLIHDESPHGILCQASDGAFVSLPLSPGGATSMQG